MIAPPDMEEIRQHVLRRFASLFENQTRANHFTGNVSELVHSVHAEMAGTLEGDSAVSGLDRALSLLFKERKRYWDENGNHLRQLMFEFNRIMEGFQETLVEKDLMERQGRVLESVVLSHEKIVQWNAFVKEILAGFHPAFPFKCFLIAFEEGHGLALHLYYPGELPANARISATRKLAAEMMANLGFEGNVPVDIRECQVLSRAKFKSPPHEDTMTVVRAPSGEASDLGGIRGVAFVPVRKPNPAEESVLRSIMTVLVMVVGSSRMLNRTVSELEYYSTHDPLTGLHNRRYFHEMIHYEEGRSERRHHEFSVLMLDLDDFKDVNDTYGHPCGDAVLKQVAETVSAVMRKGDIATRIGGDEFAIILTETGKSGGLAVAEKLRLELRGITFESPEGKPFHITTSIGLVSFPEDGNNISDLMAGVDIGLYRAKEMGKDSISTLDAAKEYIQVGRNARDNAEKLRLALKNDQIIPYYQPIFDCKSGSIFAHETLARLREPDGETVSAGMFIETIEKYGLGRELDRAILQKALTDMKGRMDNGEPLPRLFINLSAQEIQGRGILGYAEQLCQELGIPPKVVVFEILERDAIGDMANMGRFLTKLREKGFSFALDDFGSGYNSFHYLRELRFDYVKLDGDFVRNIPNSKIDCILVRNLSQMCRELGILTIAEFVESETILDALKEMGIDYVQGFHLGVPAAGMTSAR